MDVSVAEQEKDVTSEPVGDVLLGDIDPTTLTRKQFLSSPNLLFHGAGRDFAFSQNFDYKTELHDLPGSHTVGLGFYATNNVEDAQLFSQARKRDESEPIVLPVLPYHARLLDFRKRADHQANAYVPINFFREYKEYFQEYFSSRFDKNYNPKEDIAYINSTTPSEGGEERRKRVMRWYSWNISQQYLRTLNSFPPDGSIELRSMLSLTGNRHNSEYAMTIISEFMLSKGYDGLICIEGGDHPKHKRPPSYVFFNLKRIGTYEAWHQSE